MFSFGLSALLAVGCSLPDSIPVVKRIAAESTFSRLLADGTQPNATELIVTLGANEGAPLNVSVSHSSGISALDAAAINAARTAVFAPEMRGCAPVGGSYFLTIEY